MTGKVLVTGARGQLGTDLVQRLGEQHEVIGVEHDDFDLRDREDVFTNIKKYRPAVIVHAAAYTDVDGAEANFETAKTVNGDGTKNLALAAREIDARVIFYSTDYVFDGRSKRPYTEDDDPHPLTAYGRSKLAGERALAGTLENYVIMRIAWLYGAHGKNFVKTMLRLGLRQRAERDLGKHPDPLTVVDDQYGNPTWTVDVASQTAALLTTAHTGIFHATAHGEVSWYQFARDIFEAADLEIDVKPCTTADYPRPAPRPMRSSLENKHLAEVGLDRMRDYREALGEFMNVHKEKLLA